MAGPYHNISDIQAVKTYITNTEAVLDITSVASALSVSFPAFLTDFSQNFDAQWNTEDVFGRADPIATYQGTKRTMSLGFDIIAGTQKGAQRNLDQCRKLVRMVYPVYKNSVLSKAPLVRVKFANLIVGAQKQGGSSTEAKAIDTENLGKVVENTTPGGEVVFDTEDQEGIEIGVQSGTTTPSVSKSYIGLLGWISGLSWKPNLEMGMFTKNKLFFPKVIAISFTFNILHEHTPSQRDETASFPFRSVK